MAVIGTVIVLVPSSQLGKSLVGFFLMQGSNLCFAGGQLWYKDVMKAAPKKKDVEVFALLFLGGSLAALIPAWGELDGVLLQSWSQRFVVLYLGLVASPSAWLYFGAAGLRIDGNRTRTVNAAIGTTRGGYEGSAHGDGREQKTSCGDDDGFVGAASGLGQDYLRFGSRTAAAACGALLDRRHCRDIQAADLGRNIGAGLQIPTPARSG